MRWWPKRKPWAPYRVEECADGGWALSTCWLVPVGFAMLSHTTVLGYFPTEALAIDEMHRRIALKPPRRFDALGREIT